MKENDRTQQQIRRAFNSFCKKTLRNEAYNANRDLRRRRRREVCFSDLSPHEENQLYICDEYFTDDPNEKTFFVAGREIALQSLADAIRSLPDEKRLTVLTYYFLDMKDAEIARLFNVSRSSIQRRRTSAIELLKTYLEGKAHD